jgi:hypothetical protein
MNILGACVVSGGIRRVAELALGENDDEVFLKLKDYNLFEQEMKDWRWASNNTISCKVGQDYEKLSNQTATNGEPGYFWLENARKYGRIKDGETWEDVAVSGTNPCCLTSDMIITTNKGDIDIKTIVNTVQDNRDHGLEALSYNIETNELEYKPIIDGFLSGNDCEVIEVVIDIDGKETAIKCTEDHKFYTINRGYVKAIDLDENDELVIGGTNNGW